MMNSLIKKIADDFSVIENDKKYVLVKISDTPALENMKKGNWRFRHPAYFQYEDLCNGNHERGDRIDCMIERQDIYHEDKFGITARLCLNTDEKEIDSIRVMCFYKLEFNEDNGYESICERMRDFGDSFVFVNKNSFIQNISSIYHPQHNTIKYYNEEEYDGMIGKFLKRYSYIHQKEYRVIVENKNWETEISNNEQIILTRKKISNYYQIVCNVSKYSQDECINASNEIDKLEKTLCKLKKDYYKDINLPSLIQSDIFPISSLIDIV